jgi:hypothetical protein
MEEATRANLHGQLDAKQKPFGKVEKDLVFSNSKAPVSQPDGHILAISALFGMTDLDPIGQEPP